MKKSYFVVFMVFVLSVLIIGCYTVPFSGISREETIKDELFYKSTGNAKQIFSIINENSMQGILLAYERELQEYRTTSIQQFTISGKIYHFLNIPLLRKEIEWVPGKTTSRDVKTQNSKIETFVPQDGTQVVISIGNTRIQTRTGLVDPPKIQVATTNNGKIYFDSSLQSLILNSVEDVDGLRKSRITIPSLDIYTFIDLIKDVNFINPVILETQELIKTIPQYNIITSADFERYIKDIISLREKAKYKLQNLLLKNEVQSAYNKLYKSLETEKESIETSGHLWKLRITPILPLFQRCFGCYFVCFL
jgi:hypothetical protein